MMRALIVLACLSSALSARAAIATLGETVNTRAHDYELKLDRAFAKVSPGLDRWVDQQRAAACAGLVALMGTTTDLDRRFVAYHLLRLDPAQALARAAFDGQAQGAPFDSAGREVAGWSLGGVVSLDLAERVAALIHPSFEVVRDVVAVTSPVVGSYWEAQRAELQSLKADLVALRQDPQADVVFQMLAYYYPQSKDVVAYYRSKNRRVPTSRWWVDHVDQYLLDHELAGVDCLVWKPKIGAAATKAKDGTATLGSGTWAFPSCVRGLRVESVLGQATAGVLQLTLIDDKMRGVSVSLGKQGITALDLPTRKIIKQVPAPADMGASLIPFDIEIRDKRMRLSVGGLIVVDEEVSSAHAYTSLIVEGHNAPARQLRVRFIGAAPPQAPGVAPAPAGAPVEKPAPEAWVADRVKDLAKVVSANFNETPLDEAVTMLARVSGATLTLDDSGALLKDLPITLTANDMKLSSVFDCLERLADLKATPTADGFVLSWKH